MPQILVLALAGVAAYAGYRWVTRNVRDAGSDAEAVRKSASGSRSENARDQGTLVWDEKAGVYRPRS